MPYHCMCDQAYQKFGSLPHHSLASQLATQYVMYIQRQLYIAQTKTFKDQKFCGFEAPAKIILENISQTFSYVRSQLYIWTERIQVIQKTFILKITSYREISQQLQQTKRFSSSKSLAYTQLQLATVCYCTNMQLYAIKQYV